MIAPQLRIPSHISAETFINTLSESIAEYRFDHYRLYPAKNKNAWQKYLLARLFDAFQNEESIFFGDLVDKKPVLVGCKIPRWDEEHFNFRMGKVNWMLGGKSSIENEAMGHLLEKSISYFIEHNVKLVVVRIDSDDLQNIHHLEKQHFQFYETSVSPVVECARFPFNNQTHVRFLRETDIDRVLEIVEHHQYKRGHFYCDERMDHKKVDSMYVKWIQTSLRNKEPIVVIEDEGRVVGSFGIRLDPSLSTHLGYQYGRMHLLTLDPAVRGKGLGLALFQGSMILMAQMGCQWIDSGYTSKNLISARLHNKSGFHTVFEEVIFHRWLD
jgi:L-amino acid N-acyltransferase YncA